MSRASTIEPGWPPPGVPLASPGTRLDRALLADVRRAAGSPAIRAFLVLELAAGALFVARRGPAVASTVALVWLGLALVAFICWWAGRHRLAHPQAEPVPRAGGRLVAALAIAIGLALGTYGIHAALSGALVLGGLATWLLLAVRRDGAGALARLLLRDPRPFVPLLLLIALPRVMLLGPASLGRVLGALPSGLLQQLLYLVVLFSSLEAVTRRRDVAAVIAALVFAAIHVPMNLAANEGDWPAALANAVFFQATIGLIATLAFVRHRAPLPIGLAHALTIA